MQQDTDSDLLDVSWEDDFTADSAVTIIEEHTWLLLPD